MPLNGKLIRMAHVPGTLYSVNDTTVRGVPGVFSRNERVICTFSTDQGWVTLILVGALVVGSIATPWAGIITPRHKHITRYTYANPDEAPDVALQQGEEMGRFLMGSTVITLSESPALHWNKDIKPGDTVQMGQKLGEWQR